jgi:hypothetical protein
MKYNHACDLAFEVLSNNEHGNDLTPDMYRIALKKRIDELDRTDTWDEAIGIFHTHEEES